MVNLLEAARNKELRGSPFAGFHSTKGWGDTEVQVEVFQLGEQDSISPGWYWWVCWPGSLPDSDPVGPFPDAQAAYTDATGDE